MPGDGGNCGSTQLSFRLVLLLAHSRDMGTFHSQQQAVWKGSSTSALSSFLKRLLSSPPTSSSPSSTYLAGLKVPVVDDPGGDDSLVIPVAAAAVIEACVVTLPSLTWDPTCGRKSGSQVSSEAGSPGEAWQVQAAGTIKSHLIMGSPPPKIVPSG